MLSGPVCIIRVFLVQDYCDALFLQTFAVLRSCSEEGCTRMVDTAWYFCIYFPEGQILGKCKVLL